jgi:hypothetical protein
LKKFTTVIGRKTIVLEGLNCLDALSRAGYEPATKVTSINRYVGRLTNGQRYSIRVQPRTDPIVVEWDR